MWKATLTCSKFKVKIRKSKLKDSVYDNGISLSEGFAFERLVSFENVTLGPSKKEKVCIANTKNSYGISDPFESQPLEEEEESDDIRSLWRGTWKFFKCIKTNPNT